jgi:hypothetical protein
VALADAASGGCNAVGITIGASMESFAEANADEVPRRVNVVCSPPRRSLTSRSW